MNGLPKVVSQVQRKLAEKGAISIEELMELALYHPTDGLYRRTCPAQGRGTHFTTCARIGDALGRAVGRWAMEGYRALGAPPRWHAIEMGGGDGSLAGTVLEELPKNVRRRLVLHMVEICEPARELQQERLAKWCVRWHTSMAEALTEAGHEALIFSNELVDAFPAVVLEYQGQKWHEVSLVLEGHTLVEKLRSAPPWLHLNSLYSVARLKNVPEGGRAEVHRSYREWLLTWISQWRRGWMLTIDYGGDVHELYARGGAGSLRAYFSNIRLEEREEIYQRLGLQDLTCDVNFTDLVCWGEQMGLSSRALITQRDFLLRYNIKDLDKRGSAEAFVAQPGGAGTRFRVLRQERL